VLYATATVIPTEESLSDIGCSRPATAEDEAFLFRLFAESRMAELAGCGIPPSQAEMLVQFQRRGQQITYLRQYPRAENLILLSECGIPAGRLLLDKQPERWRIVDIAVLEEYQRRGITSRAIRNCQSRTPSVRLELQVNPANPARHLYQRLGFRVVTETAASLEMIWTDPSAPQ
jgi:ribosomal protein S18 acetylase RimI-like enzyme